MKTNHGLRLTALLLCGVLLLSLCPLEALAQELSSQKAEMIISKKDDFLRFVENCRLDSWSRDRVIRLETDIDLAEYEPGGFNGIASFSGTFKGNGHTISNFQLTGVTGASGLFRYLEENGTIEDLNLKGSAASEQPEDILGALVGVNAGTLRGCSFSGTVFGNGITGGLVGQNGTTGTISKCTAEGKVSSNHFVGGIVGKNYGVISDCTNSANINSDTSWMDDDENLQQTGSLTDYGKEVITSGNDVGGIAGWSSGMLAGCKNNGIVGYLKTGRNVGGIVGRQSGTVTNCRNKGSVYGKQDVGGIVGQFEPSVSPEDTEKLNIEVNKLHDLIGKTISDASSMSSTFHGDLSDLQAHAEVARQASSKLLSEGRQVAESGLSNLEELSDRMDHVMIYLPDIMKNLGEAMAVMDDVSADLTNVKDDLDIPGKMENGQYDPLTDQRLSLTTGIGGSMLTDNPNPAEGTTVTVTAAPNDGYALSSLICKNADGTVQDVTASVSDNAYTFAMPSGNVHFDATFRYLGGYVCKSNPGGDVSAAQSGDTLSIRAVPQAGYKLVGLTVDGTPVDISSGDGDVYTVPKPSNPSAVIEAAFEASESTYAITIPSTTGGRVTTDKLAAAPGTTVILTVTPNTDYAIKSLQINGVDATPEGDTYTFTMPSEDATVAAEFSYDVTDGTVVYALSSVGGTLRATENIANTNQWVITILPDGDYALSDSGTVLTITDANGTTREVTASELQTVGTGYTYTLNVEDLQKPVKVYGSFEKNVGQTTVTCVGSAGGMVTSDKTTAGPGDTIHFAVVSRSPYAIERVTVNDADYTGAVSEGTFSYTMPESDLPETLTVKAWFSPVVVIIESGDSVGGSGSYQVSGNTVTVKITPDSGYVPTVTATGADLQKIYADSYEYRFDADQAQMPVTVHVSFERMSDKDTVDGAKDRIEDNLTVVSDSMSQVEVLYNQITDILTDEYGNPRDVNDLSEEELQQLKQLLTQLGKAVSQGTTAAGQIARDANTIGTVSDGYIEDAMSSLSGHLDELNDHLNTMTAALAKAGDGIAAIGTYFDGLESIEITTFSPDFEKNAQQLSDEMASMSQILKRLNDNMNTQSSRLTGDLTAVNDQLNVVLGIIIGKLDMLENVANGEDIYEDHSAQEDTAATKVISCTNDGAVDGASNVGGIAGTMGVEKNEQDEQSITISFGSRYLVSAVLRSCKNNGFVTVKTENGGGIAGLVEIGLVGHSIGGGTVTGGSALCVGSIAGTSHGTIANCYGLSELKGSDYVGGIAGRGDAVSDCFAMVVIPQFTGRIGAVLGGDEPGEDEDPAAYRAGLSQRIHGNYYVVNNHLCGIDGISYAGVAEPITYTQLMRAQSVPEEFKHLYVTFTDSTGSVISRTEVEYGARLDTLTYPQLGSSGTSYTDWEGYIGQVMEGNVYLQSSEVAVTTILSSIEQENAKPVALAEGAFRAEAYLVVDSEQELPPPEKLPDNTQCRYYTVTVENTQPEESGATRVRLLAEGEETVSVYRYTSGTWMQEDSKRIGQYMQVDMQGSSETYCLASTPRASKLPLILTGACAGGAAVLGLLLWKLLHGKNKKQKKTPGKYAQNPKSKE